MNSKLIAAALVAAGLALSMTQAQAEPRLSFINKYIEKYAKVKPDGTIAGYKVSSLSGESTTNGLSTASGDSAPRSITKRIANARSNIGKKSP